jgi:hypothetical protein
LNSSGLIGIPGGHPSITQPIAGPWLSPKVVTVKSLPKELLDTRFGRLKETATA